jgi:hypothetical protein
MRNLNTIETGYDAPDQTFELWASGSYEQPFQFENQKTWLNPIITPASVVSAGTRVKMTSNFWFTGSALFVNEEPFKVSSDLPSVTIDLPSRFPIKQGVSMGGELHFTERTRSDMKWTQDLRQQNHMASFTVRHWIPQSQLEIGAGADLVVSDTTKGWIGQYRGDDRIRGWMKYVF